MANMHDLDGFVKVECVIADVIRNHEVVKPMSSLTDVESLIFTEWGLKENEKVVLKEFRYPNSDRECEHYVPGPGFDYDAYNGVEE